MALEGVRRRDDQAEQDWIDMQHPSDDDHWTDSSEASTDDSDTDEEAGAPEQLKLEFLECLMSKNYHDALKLCRMLLMYEPNHPDAVEFLPLIEEKIEIDARPVGESDDEDESEDDEEEDDEDEDEDDDEDEEEEDEEDSTSSDDDYDEDFGSSEESEEEVLLRVQRSVIET